MQCNAAAWCGANATLRLLAAVSAAARAVERRI